MMGPQSLYERVKWQFQPFVGWAMEKMVRLWANNYMDQFEHFKFLDSFGNTVYVSITYVDEYPDSFVNLDNPDQPYGSSGRT